MAEKKSAKKSTEKPAEKQEVKKPKKGLLIGIGAAVIAAIVGIVIALVLNFSNNGTGNDITSKLSYTNSFFIYDSDKYTLWNAEGKRLTEDEYTEQSAFVGGYAYVKKDGQVGIISDSGKMSVEFGKFGSITPKGGLYLVQDGNTKEYRLITGTGKELAKGEKLDVYFASSTSGFAAVNTDHKIKIFNYAGKLVADLEEADDADDPVTSGLSDFGILHYAGKNTLFDARTGEMLAQFEGDRYTFEEVSDNRAKVLLENDKESNKYKLVADKKVYDLNEMKYYGFTKGGDILLGYDNDSEIALLDNNYKVMKKVPTYLQLKDTTNYAVKNADNKVEIYRNGEKIKEFENAKTAVSGILDEDFYVIKQDDKVKFYRLDGSVAFDHEYKEARLFDKHHHAVVSDDGNEYYLINTNGNAVSDLKLTKISYYDGGYELKNSDNKFAVANKDGKPVTEFKYTSTYYRSSAEPRNIWTGSVGNGNVDIIDVDKAVTIAGDVNVKDFYANYFTVKNADGKTEYHTYTGAVFYTSK